MSGVLEDVEQLEQDAAKLAATLLWPLTDAELTACLEAAHRAEQAVLALQARLVHQAATRGLPATAGQRSTTGWLRAHLRLDPGPARELADRATALAQHPVVEQALLEGHVDARQAAVITTAVTAVTTGLAELDRLVDVADGEIDPTGHDADAALDPTSHGADAELDPTGHAAAAEIARQAESTLIEMAGRLPAYQLRRVGERILAYVAPHLADRADAAMLARQEERAHRARGFTLANPVDGMVRLSGVLGAEDAALLQAALHPLCSPIAEDERRPAQRRADALVEVCRLALRTGELPRTGGEPAQLAVTVDYDILTRALGTATTDTGARLSAEAARRLACDARVLPAVLGTAGQVLDLGRSHRLAGAALRRALTIRDIGCAFPDCDRPPRWTDAHHITAWTNGGPTSLDNLVLLCRHHHRLIHHPTAGWRIRLGPDQHPVFIPPPRVDPARHPRRNLHHPRRRTGSSASPTPEASSGDG